MHITAGKILISSGIMDDVNFKQSMIFIAEHNENGALAFVVNKMAERPLHALVEFGNSPLFPLYNGGPVDIGHLFFIHQRKDLIAGGTHIINNIYLGGNFKQAIAHINSGLLTEADIKIFIGYCGWDKGELEEEIASGNWLITGNGCDIAFEKTPLLPE